MMRKHRKGPHMEPSPELLAAKQRAEDANMRANQELARVRGIRHAWRGTTTLITEARKYDAAGWELDSSFGGTP